MFWFLYFHKLKIHSFWHNEKYANYKTIIVCIILCNKEFSYKNEGLSQCNIKKVAFTVSKTKLLVSHLCKVNWTQLALTINDHSDQTGNATK